jgi:hypothetical protein
MSISIPIAWVLRASTANFTVGCRLLEATMPQFGSFVQVQVTPAVRVIGITYDIRVNDDPSVRQLILADDLEPAVILDQRQNRLVPIEMSVLAVGYEEAGVFYHNLPPQPPISLDGLHFCTPSEIVRFTERLDYLRLIIKAPQISTDELLIANLAQTAAHYVLERRRAFLLQAAREISRYLSGDLVRLDGILRQIRWVASSESLS